MFEPLDDALRTLLAKGSRQEAARRLAEDGVALFAAHRLAAELDSATVSQLRAAALPYVAITMRQHMVAKQLTRLLADASIDHVMLKGPILADAWHRAFGADTRTYSDVDVLVGADQVAAAEDLLQREAGAVRATESVGEHGLVMASGGVVDLHWLLLNDQRLVRRHRFDTAALLRNVRRDTELPRLPIEEMLVHVSLHALVSDATSIAAVLDVAAVVSLDELDCDRLAESAARHRAQLAVAVMVDRAAELSGSPKAQELAARLPRSLWRTACRTLVRSHEPATGRHWTGGELLRATRASSAGSIGAVFGRAPANVRTQWRMRHHRLDVPLRPTVALISLEPWDEVWRRNQHLVRELMRQRLIASIVYIDPPSLGSRAAVTTPMPDVTVVRPPLVVPRSLAGLRLTALWLRRKWLRDVDVVWVNDPTLGVHCLSGGRPAVYDVTDDWRMSDRPARLWRRMVAAEDKLARIARTVVCSPELARRWHDRYGVAAAVVQNAAVTAQLESGTGVQLQGDAPHVGYVGTLHQERLDVDLTLALASSDAVGTVHLVGPDALAPAERTRLGRHPKVRIELPVPALQVPAWLMSFDVLVAPHVVTDFTLSLDAIKAFEYLATDRPVVATPTSGFQSLTADGLDVVPAEQFVAAVERAARSDARYTRTVAEWSDRAREFARSGLGLPISLPERQPA